MADGRGKQQLRTMWASPMRLEHDLADAATPNPVMKWLDSSPRGSVAARVWRLQQRLEEIAAANGPSMNVTVSWSGHAMYFIMFMVGHTAALAQSERHLLSWRASLPPARALRLRNASQEAARLTLWLFWVSRALSAQLNNLVIRALHDPSECRRTRPTCSVL